MAELKPYLVSTNPIIANYIKTHPQTVFDEDKYNSNTTRVWISFDIDDKLAPIGTRKKLYDWINAYDAESWGNSNATFLLNGWTPDNEYLGDWLISELTTANVLDKTNWEKTKGISLRKILFPFLNIKIIETSIELITITFSIIRLSKAIPIEYINSIMNNNTINNPFIFFICLIQITTI